MAYKLIHQFLYLHELEQSNNYQHDLDLQFHLSNIFQSVQPTVPLLKSFIIDCPYLSPFDQRWYWVSSKLSTHPSVNNNFYLDMILLSSLDFHTYILLRPKFRTNENQFPMRILRLLDHLKLVFARLVIKSLL